MCRSLSVCFVDFLNDTATPELYTYLHTLSLHYALPISTDAYLKLRNTFRSLLGALDGFSEEERLGVNEMPKLERYVLHLLFKLDEELKAAANAFEFNRYIRALTDFAKIGRASCRERV